MKTKKLIAGLLAITIVFGAGGVPGNIGKDIFTLSASAENYEGQYGDLFYRIAIGMGSEYDEETGEYIPECEITGFAPDAVSVTIPEKIDGYKVVTVPALYSHSEDDEGKGSDKLEVINLPKTIEHFYGIRSTNAASGSDHYCIEAFPKLREINVDKDNKTIYSVDGVLYEHRNEYYTEQGDELLFYPADKRDKTFTIPKEVVSISKISPIYSIYVHPPFSSANKNESEEIRHDRILCNTHLENIIIPKDSLMKQYFSYDGVVYSYGTMTDDNGNEQIDKSKVSYVLCPSGKKKVKLPDGMEIVTGFDCCRSLEEIEIPDSVKYVGDGFNYTPLLENQKGPVKYVGKWAVSCVKDSKEKIEIKDDTVGLSNKLLEKCSQETIVIPESVKYVGYNGPVFGGSLKKVEFLNPDVEIRPGAFSDSNVEEVVLPQGMKEIGKQAFANAMSLEKINIPDSVSSIEDSAFYWCIKLKSITIPKSVTKIADNAFPEEVVDENKHELIHNPIVISGYKNSAAEKYAKDNGFKFVELKEETKPDNSSKIDDSSKKNNSSKSDSKKDESSKSYSSSKKNDSSKKDSSSKPETSSSPDSKPDDSSKPDNVKFSKGDANGDNDINVTDISVTAAHIKGIKPLTDEQQKAADVNSDNEVNVTDIAMIAAHIKGIKALV